MEENKQNASTEPVSEQNKENKNDKTDPNRITVFEYVVFFLLIAAVLVYISPKFLLKSENAKNALVQTNASIFTSKALSEFSGNKKAKASVVAKKIIEELNAVNKNPVNKKEPAYSAGKQCPGCVIISVDDKINSITVAGYSKNGELLVRTLIQPPSFVTYTKDLSEDNNKKD